MLRPIRSLRRISLPGLLIAAFLLPSLLMPALASAGEPVFVFTGRGYGHGIGMSQWGAKGYAEHGYTWDYILRHYFTGTGIGSITNPPPVRVALHKYNTAQSSWQLAAYDAPLWVTNGTTGFSIAKGSVVTFTPVLASGVRVVGGGVDKTLWGGSWWAYSNRGGGSIGLTRVVSATGTWSRANIVYRGKMRLVNNGKALNLYNHPTMEEYLKGVVPRESISSWPIEALKAQAVAARSYAFRSLVSGGVFDVYPTTTDQVYGGYGLYTSTGVQRYETDRTNLAVDQTVGKVVKYGSEVVMTYFFSTSGGYTENVENVWGNATAKPYYTAVADPYEASSGASRHVWQSNLSYTASQLRAKFVAAGIPVPGVLTDVVVTKRSPSGRAKEVVLKGAAGDHKVLDLKDPVTGVNEVGRIRNGLGLDSTWFYVTSAWVSGPSTVAYGVSARFNVTVRPGITSTGLSYVYSGPAGGSLSGPKSTVPVTAGSGSFTFAPTGASDLVLSSGSRGYGTYFVSPRFRVQVARRLSVTAKRSGSNVELGAAVTPASGAGNVVFEYRREGTSQWQTLATKAVSASGFASAVHTPASSGTWHYRLRHPGGSGFVAGTSAVASVSFSDSRVQRLFGDDRYATALKVAEAYGATRDGVVVIAGGESGPDALTGAALASAYGAPLLLVGRDTVPAQVETWLKDPAHNVQSAIVVGGTSAVSGAVASRIDSLLPGAVTRLDGADRYVTAGKVAERVKAKLGAGYDGGAMFVNGASMTDAAVAGAVSAHNGWPILFVQKSAIPAATTAALSSGIGATQAWIVGGTALVDPSVQAALDARSARIVRAAGEDRFATALDLAAKATGASAASYARVGIVSDTGLVDALALSPYVAKAGGVILLTPRSQLHADVKTRLAANESAVQRVVVAGGTGVVSDAVIAGIDAALP